MIIGILNTDTLNAEIVSKYGNYRDMFQRLLHSVDDQHTFKPYSVTHGEYPDNINECDAYLITGSKASAYEDITWITQLKDYIKVLVGQRKKLVGICFGHQIIAEALGGRVQKNQSGWGVGLMSSNVLRAKPWMKPAQEHYLLLVSHQDQVTKLPTNAESISSNAFCPNSSYQIGKHVLTFQGHPEFTADFLRQSMQGRREIIGEQKYQQALATLNQDAHEKIIAQWILNFISEGTD